MKQNNYAVLIGYNRYNDYENFPDLNYACKDANDMYGIITNPEIGEFLPENVTLVNDENPLSTDNIEELLYSTVVKNCGPEDTVMFYFSGHGIIAGERRRAYLATPDVTLLTILGNPKAGLGMAELYNDYFLESHAGNVIFIMDCCFSGSFGIRTNNEGDIARSLPADSRRLFVDERFFRGDGRTALVSTSSKGVSRESHEFQNGIFTYYLINGLKGACTEKYSGEVTLTTLAAYAQSMMAEGEKPLIIGRPSKTILTKPGVQANGNETLVNKNLSGFRRSEYQPNIQSDLMPLENPVSRYIGLIKDLIANLIKLDQDENKPLATRVLSSIRKALNCDFVFVRRVNSEKGDITKFHSDFDLDGIDLASYEEDVLRRIYPYLVRSKRELLPVRYGFYNQLDNLKGPNDKPYLIVIPLKLDDPKEFVVFCGLGTSELSFGEMLGHMTHSIYRSTNQFTTFQSLIVESALYDDLKRGFSNIPHEMYLERFSMFKERLHQVHFYFEPVVHIGCNEIEIDSWEALAREGNQGRAPAGLFRSAELWGPEFITELDIYCLRKAISSYTELWRKERPNQKKDPLSVNVYPETLFRKAYKTELNRIIKEEGMLFGDKLVLEISEKRSISDPDYEVLSIFDQLKNFERKLKELVSEFNISFAIDDFGIAHSSVSRMAHLQLDHVKIDRDILLHPYPSKTISYVQDLVHQSHSHRVKVVIEGFDEDITNISFSELFNCGVDYVQGHLIRRAAPTVNALSNEKIELLNKLVHG